MPWSLLLMGAASVPLVLVLEGTDNGGGWGLHLQEGLYAVMMVPAYEFAPLVALPGWRFAELIEVEVARGLPIDSASIARIEGEHPVFGFRRQYLLPRLVQRSDDGVIRLRYGYPAAGLYELRRMDRGITARRAILIDEWRQIFEIPWDVLELLAPVIEQARARSVGAGEISDVAAVPAQAL